MICSIVIIFMEGKEGTQNELRYHDASMQSGRKYRWVLYSAVTRCIDAEVAENTNKIHFLTGLSSSCWYVTTNYRCTEGTARESTAWSYRLSQPLNHKFFSKGSVPTAKRPCSLMFVPLKSKKSSEINDERHANPSPVIELQSCKLSSVSRVSDVEIAKRL